MDWHESATEGLPPPHPEEPPSLRRDIADELGDHLACSFAREIKRTGGDEQAARRAVLDRFGDPRKIARRLWLDAMKEVLMNQRILLTTCIILTAACVAVAAFSFLSLKQSRQANEAVQKANAAVMGKLEEISKAAEANSVWSHLTIRVRRGTDDGSAVEGIPVSLLGKPYTESDQRLTTKTDSNGCCRFGPVRVGRYSLTVGPESRQQTDAKEYPYVSRRNVMLYPSEQQQTITYPEIPMTQIAFAPEWPSEFADKDIVLQCQFEFQMPSDWQLPSDYGSQGAPTSTVLCDRRGDLYERSWHPQVMPLKKYTPPKRLMSALALAARVASIQVLYRVGDGATTAPYELVASYLLPVGRRLAPPYPLLARPRIENVWKIELPEQLIQQTRTALPRFLRPDEKVAGRIVQSVPVEKEREIRISGGSKHMLNDQANETYVANFDGGVRNIVKWADVPEKEAQSDDRRFILALYSLDTTSGTIPPSQLLVHEITESWAEQTSPTLRPAPAWSSDPAGRFDFEPGAGWKLFDVTPVVRAQARGHRPNHGVLIRFEREDVKLDRGVGYRRWSGYRFEKRPAVTYPPQYRNPRLLVVEPKR